MTLDRGALALAACLWAGAGCSGPPDIRYLPAGETRAAGVFVVDHFAAPDALALPEGEIDPQRAAGIFEVRVVAEGAATRSPAADLPAVAGAYRRAGDRLEFEPRFPLSPGVRYRARYLPGTPRALEREVLLPAPVLTPVTVVEAVYPSAETLPENLLKFYFHFSAPMSRRQAWDHLRLRERSGTVVKYPFLELDEELWDRSGRRLTVFIDPGRVKRGVAPLEDLGPTLRAGHEYVLEIDAGWEDAAGRPLLRGFSKEFGVGPPDRTSPDPAGWKIAPPRAGARGPLAVTLGEPLDHGLLYSNLAVEGPDGAAIEGTIEVGDHETSWSFVPDRPWAEGGHRLVVATTLEDLAGNDVGKPFEVDVLEQVQKRVEVQMVKLDFRPLPSSN